MIRRLVMPTNQAAQRASLRVELVACSPGADEHVLGDLAGAVVAEGAPADRVDERAVGVVDRSEVGLSTRERLRQVGVMFTRVGVSDTIRS